jgi:hypothetical protein
MSDEYEIVWKEGSFFEKGGWRIQKKSDSGGEIVAFFLIAALVFFVVCIAVMTLALIGPLFVIWQMHKRLRYVGGIVGIIGFIYFLIDLQKEWISSVLFYGWTNDDGEFNNGVLGEDALSIFWVINIVGILVSTWLTFEHLLKEKDLSFDSYNLKRIRRRFLFLTDKNRKKRLKRLQSKPVQSAKKVLKATVSEKLKAKSKEVKKSSSSKINLIGGVIFGVILLGAGLYVFVDYSRYDVLAIKTSGKSYTDLDERDKMDVETLANHEENQAEDFGLNEINYYVDEVNTNDAEIEESVEVNSEINLGELTIIGDDIWVRSTPIDGEVVMHLYEGDRCEVISKCCYQDIRGNSDYWYEIEHNNESGWVFGNQTSKAEVITEMESMDDCSDCHTVQSGESMASIAEFYSLDIEQLEDLNPHVKDRWIKQGMKLHIQVKRLKNE